MTPTTILLSDDLRDAIERVRTARYVQDGEWPSTAAIVRALIRDGLAARLEGLADEGEQP